MPSIYARQGMPCWKEDSLIEAWHRSPLYCHHFVSAWAKHPVRNTGRAHIVGITLQGKNDIKGSAAAAACPMLDCAAVENHRFTKNGG